MSDYVDRVLGLKPPGKEPEQERGTRKRYWRPKRPPATQQRELKYVDSVRCGYCQGMGEDDCGGICNVCSGNGEVTVEPPVITCLECRGDGHGKGSLTCLACQGIGVVSVSENATICSHCQGSGEDGVFGCMYCKGQGVC